MGISRNILAISWAYLWHIAGIFYAYLGQVMHDICSKDGWDMAKTWPRYAHDMPKICQKYGQGRVKICPRYAHKMAKICPRYAQDICPRYKRQGWNLRKSGAKWPPEFWSWGNMSPLKDWGKMSLEHFVLGHFVLWGKMSWGKMSPNLSKAPASTGNYTTRFWCLLYHHLMRLWKWQKAWCFIGKSKPILSITNHWPYFRTNSSLLLVKLRKRQVLIEGQPTNISQPPFQGIQPKNIF